METMGTMVSDREYAVYRTTAGWFIFRGGPLTFPLAGPYDTEREATDVFRAMIFSPFAPFGPFGH